MHFLETASGQDPTNLQRGPISNLVFFLRGSDWCANNNLHTRVRSNRCCLFHLWQCFAFLVMVFASGFHGRLHRKPQEGSNKDHRGRTMASKRTNCRIVCMWLWNAFAINQCTLLLALVNSRSALAIAIVLPTGILECCDGWPDTDGWCKQGHVLGIAQSTWWSKTFQAASDTETG